MAETSVPQHVAIIMDGNSRWARKQGKPPISGHRQGAEVLKDIVEAAAKQGVKYLTAYAFSSENWHRPQGEVNALMNLLRHYLKKELAHLQKKEIRLRIIGDRHRLSKDIIFLINRAEEETRYFDQLHLTLAISYGGRGEIISACQAIAEKIKDHLLSAHEVTEEIFNQHLYTCDLPCVDLFIRTSGELRMSNFLLWQSAYAELYFIDTLWPDFTQSHFKEALQAYQKRERRFGMVVPSCKQEIA